MSVLVVVSHPDDETLGAGGTIARHAANGDQVRVLILSKTGFARDNESPNGAYQNRRRKQAQDACQILGVSSVSFLDFPESDFDTIPLLELTKCIEEEIKEINPEIIYTHFQGDLNKSHQRTYEAVLTAARPLPESPVRRILSFEIPSSTEWSQNTAENTFSPNVFIDISEYLSTKIRALSQYQGELRDHPHPRNTTNICRNARLSGTKAGVEAAERFVLCREIK